MPKLNHGCKCAACKGRAIFHIARGSMSGPRRPRSGLLAWVRLVFGR